LSRKRLTVKLYAHFLDKYRRLMLCFSKHCHIFNNFLMWFRFFAISSCLEAYSDAAVGRQALKIGFIEVFWQ